MTVTREYIETSLNNVRKQREDAVSMARRCEGAIEILESLLKRIDAPEPEGNGAA